MGKARRIVEDTLIICGFIFIQVVVHEIVHMIDGWNSNVAVCFSFASLRTAGFVLHGVDYTLYNGELLAYATNIIIAVVFYYLVWREKI